jgi:glycerophosphoryl diester phosphodiesterase
MAGDRNHFLIFGHRGSPRRFPENTLASFDEALRAGADGFETDLRLLSDGQAVLFHDHDFEDQPVETFSAPDLPSVQLLSSLSRYAGRTTMILEVKRGDWVDALLAQVSGWPNIVIASFDHSLIAELSRRRVSFPLGLTVEGVIVDLPSYARQLGATWCFPDHRYVDAPLVQRLHQTEVRVVPWTPNRGRDWNTLKEIGCDGIITDYPAEAVAWRSQSG